ncbi:DUF4278 domain-containing protein (plasmid) [Nostoc sp. C057]|nr:DUF4278 domain-containing protein [Nostoc sp. C057]
MKLYYRGLSYEYNSREAAKRAIRPFAPVHYQGSAYNLTYRGQTKPIVLTRISSLRKFLHHE